MPTIQPAQARRPFPRGGDLSGQDIATRAQLESALLRQKTMSHLRLGDALVQQGLVSVQQRDDALATQLLHRGKRLGEILVEAGAVSEESIRRVLVEQLGVPSVSLGRIGCEPDAIAAVSAAFARKYVLLPLYRTSGRIAVAMENPLWWEALKELESSTGLMVDAAMAPRADLLAAIERHYESRDADSPHQRVLDRLRMLSARVLSIQEEERRRISRDLHDDVGQSLTALKIALHRLAPLPGPENLALHGECIAMADATLERVHQLASDMRPPQLDELGLEEALRWLVERQRAATGRNIKCHFNGLLGRRLPAALESACYRITQEALSNATRHADASSILVSVEASSRALVLTIRDDGKGLEQGAEPAIGTRPSGLGLIGMAERADLAGGLLTISGEAGQGTIVRAVFGLGRPQERP
jgi:signal transduction histidine kinase